MKTGIVIQARMGSTRLPGKVLLPLPENHPDLKVLDWVIEACVATEFPVWVATSTNEEDDAIVEYVTADESWGEAGVGVFRGHATDVLDRIYQCARENGLEEIIRVTGDCPFVDADIIRQVVALRRDKDADYASNVDPATWPDGLDVQCVTIDVLGQAHRHAHEDTDRDTVLQWIVRNRKEFEVVNLPCPIRGLTDQRWVLDTWDDYRTLNPLAEKLHPSCSWTQVLEAARDINPAGITGEEGARNERYLAARSHELRCDDFTASIGASQVARTVQPYGASTYSKSYVAWGRNSPLVVTHASGSRVFDVDGNEYIDWTGALGTTILGHSDPRIRDAITSALDQGIAFPFAHDRERQVAQHLLHRLHWRDGQVVFGKNGSDVCSAAVRLARVVTGRSQVMMLKDHYHGWHDWAVHSTPRGSGVADDCGVYRAADLDELLGTATSADSWWKHVAAVIVEPDRIGPDDCVRIIHECRRHGALVIFDEMVSAFRYPRLTYSATHGLEPDLLCLGKALGNGMPITALIGRTENMKRFVTDEPGRPYAFYSGTHFGDNLSLAAAEQVLAAMQDEALARLAVKASKVNSIVSQAVHHYELQGLVSVFKAPLTRLTWHQPTMAARFRRDMASHGCLVYSAFFAMEAHTEADLDRLDYALNETFREINEEEEDTAIDTACMDIMRS